MNFLKKCSLLLALLGLFLSLPILLEAQQSTTKGLIVLAYFFPYDKTVVISNGYCLAVARSCKTEF